jgi:hypothetical protein
MNLHSFECFTYAQKNVLILGATNKLMINVTHSELNSFLLAQL